jgi:hypothetical protein
MKELSEIREQLRIARCEGFQEFRPCAYFDESLDCIRVVARDCSILETRINQYITVLEDNYEESDEKKYVGFTVKGARHFCQEHGFDLNVPINIGNVLDKMMANSPEPAVQMTIRLVAKPLMKKEGLTDVTIPPVPADPVFA